MPALADGIVDFSDIVKGKVDEKAVQIAANAGEVLVALADTVPNTKGLVGYLVGNNDIDAFGKKLPTLAEGIVSFSDIVAGRVDATAVETATNAGELITTLSNHISETKIGGFFGFLNTGMTNFSKDIQALADGIASFSGTVAGKVDATAVETATNAGELLTALSNRISETKTGGFWGFLNKGMVRFGEQIKPLGEGIAAFSGAVAGKVDQSAVTTATQAGDLIATLSDKVSETTGSWITNLFGGDTKKFKNFKEQMPLLGDAVVAFSNSISGKINSAAVTSAETVIKVLDILSAYSSDDVTAVSQIGSNLASFGTNIVSFGKSFTTYCEEVQTVSNYYADYAMSRAAKVVESSKSLSGVNTTSMSQFGSALTDLGSRINKYFDYITDMNVSEVTVAMGKVDGLIAMARNMAGLDTSGMTQFGKDLKTLGTNGVKEFVKAFSDADTTVKNAAAQMLASFRESAKSESVNVISVFNTIVSEIIAKVRSRYADVKSACVYLVNALIAGANSKSGDFSDAFVQLVESAIAKVKEKHDSAYSAGEYLVDGFAAGIGEHASKAADKARAMAKAAVDAIEDELDINSPSKVLYRDGEFSGMGFVNALEDYADKAYDAGVNLAESTKIGLSNAVAKMVDMIDEEVGTEPTIRPVLDLTNIEAGTRQLNTMFARTQAMSIDVGNRHGSVDGQNGAASGRSGTTYQFTQNNYSPKALSRIDIYRQTKNQFSAIERMVEA